jgi:hypothetical protein
MRPIGKSAGLAAAPPIPADADDWEEVGGDVDQPTPFFTFSNPGDAIEGQLCPTRTVRDKSHYVIEDLRGKRWTLPDHARLVKKLARVQVGNVVRITYEGEETFESRNYGIVTAKLYTVQRRKAAPLASSAQHSSATLARAASEPFHGEEDDPDAGD